MTADRVLAKAAEFVGSKRPFVLATVDADCRPQMRWMGALFSDPEQDHVHYMACGAKSRKVGQISANAAAQLLYTSDDYSCTLTISGVAEVVEDQATKQMVWDALPDPTKYFSGPEGEDFGVISFRGTAIEMLCMEEGHGPMRVEL